MRSKPDCRTDAQNIPTYQVTALGGRRAVACPGDDAGVQTKRKLKLSCFELNLAEAYPVIDAGEGEV